MVAIHLDMNNESITAVDFRQIIIEIANQAD